MATEEQIRAEQASQILNSPVFEQAFDRVINNTVQAIADAPVEESEMRNQLGLFLGAANAFKAELFEHINTAKLDESGPEDQN